MKESYGYIYIMKNKAMPGIYKIGYAYNPENRAWQLYEGITGVPAPFKVVFKYRLPYSLLEAAEKRIHQQLDISRHRINKYREFFQVPLDIAKAVVIDQCEKTQLTQRRGASIADKISNTFSKWAHFASKF